jgi:hypothetical protein
MVCHGLASADGGPKVPFYEEIRSWDLETFAVLFLPVFCPTVIVEYIIVSCLLGWPAKGRMQLFLWVLFLNTITVPAAEAAWLFIADPLALGSEMIFLALLCVIELIVVIVQFFLLRWIFTRMLRRGLLDRPVTAGRTFMISLVANAASFLFAKFAFPFLLVPVLLGGSVNMQYDPPKVVLF